MTEQFGTKNKARNKNYFSTSLVIVKVHGSTHLGAFGFLLLHCLLWSVDELPRELDSVTNVVPVDKKKNYFSFHQRLKLERQSEKTLYHRFTRSNKKTNHRIDLQTIKYIYI